MRNKYFFAHLLILNQTSLVKVLFLGKGGERKK